MLHARILHNNGRDRDYSMEESKIIRNELDQLVEKLLTEGRPAGWIGLELLTLGSVVLVQLMGQREMAEYFRRAAEKFEDEAVRIEGASLGVDWQGYSALG